MPSGKTREYLAVIKIINRLYGRTPAAEFGPVALKVVREAMVATGWKRRTVNQRVHFVRRIMRWAVEHQMISPNQLVSLKAVEPLRQGNTVAPESDEIQPVAIEHVEACIADAPPTLAAMVRLQMFTGMRAGELCQMRSGDIDTKDKTVWVYRPGHHKNKHRGQAREIAIGPRAIKILKPLLKPDLAAFVFSPAQVDAERRATKSENRKTPLGQGNRPGTNRKAKPAKTPGDCYDTDSYRRAIEYATRKAFPPPSDLRRKDKENTAAWKDRLGPDKWAELRSHHHAHHWHPHQLRHTFGTLVVIEFTAEHAQRSLGHSNMKATQIYAKLSLEKAKEVARAIG